MRENIYKIPARRSPPPPPAAPPSKPPSNVSISGWAGGMKGQNLLRRPVRGSAAAFWPPAPSAPPAPAPAPAYDYVSMLLPHHASTWDKKLYICPSSSESPGKEELWDITHSNGSLCSASRGLGRLRSTSGYCSSSTLYLVNFTLLKCI